MKLHTRAGITRALRSVFAVCALAFVGRLALAQDPNGTPPVEEPPVVVPEPAPPVVPPDAQGDSQGDPAKPIEPNPTAAKPATGKPAEAQPPAVSAPDKANPTQKPADEAPSDPVAVQPVKPAVASERAPTNAGAASAPDIADYARPFDEASYESELARLVATYPSRMRVESLGTSKQGRRIALVTLADLAGDPDTRPAALMATDLEARFGTRPGGPEAALYVLRTLLERAEREPELAELLMGVTLYAVPAPDPDGVFAATGPVARTCRLERNFPAGWQPSEAIDCPQGPYPCSEPETRELARLVAQRTNVGALALFARQLPAPLGRVETASSPTSSARHENAGGTTAGTVENALAHVAARATLDAAVLARARDAALAQPGSLAAFARARAGACVLVLDPWSGEAATKPAPSGEAATQPAPSGEAATQPAPSGEAATDDAVRPSFAALPTAVEALLHELPRLEGQSVRAERLREHLWLVEVELRVAGGLPTASAEERARAPASVWLDVAGARVSKIGLRRDGQPVGNLDVPRGTTWRIGHLAGNEAVRLYLAVEGDEGGTLRLAFRSLRGGHAEFDVSLGR